MQKSLNLLVLFFALSGCSLMAQPYEAPISDNTSLASWSGYYQPSKRSRFSIFHPCMKIDNNFVYEKSLFVDIESGRPSQQGTYAYKVAFKTKEYTTTNIVKKNGGIGISPKDELYITNRLQMVLNSATDKNSTNNRVFDIQSIYSVVVKFENKGSSWKPNWQPVETNTNSYNEMRGPRIITSDSSVDKTIENVPWDYADKSPTVHEPLSFTPIKLPPDDDKRPFLTKVTGGKKSKRFVLTPVAEKNSMNLMGILGMGQGSIVELFSECEKNADGTPKLDKDQKIWGYAYGGGGAKFPLYYDPIVDNGENVQGRSKNRFGVYWFYGTVPVLLDGPARLPIYIWGDWIFSGVLRRNGEEIQYNDYIILTEILFEHLFPNNLIAIAEESSKE